MPLGSSSDAPVMNPGPRIAVILAIGFRAAATLAAVPAVALAGRDRGMTRRCFRATTPHRKAGSVPLAPVPDVDRAARDDRESGERQYRGLVSAERVVRRAKAHRRDGLRAG